MVDEDGEILVNAEAYDMNEAIHDANERRIDAERQALKESGDL